jgi:type III secretory pathway component EscR
LWWSVPGLVLVGYFYIGTLTGLNASVQLNAPAAERSRILSLYTMSLSIFYPLGSLVQALLVHALGLRAVTALGALVGLALALGIFIGRPQYFNELAGTDTRP